MSKPRFEGTTFSKAAPDKSAPQKRMHPADWAGRIRAPEWQIYEAVLDAAAAAKIPFALGGAFGLSTYTEVWRNTKDLDLIVLPRHRKRMIAMLTRLGLSDYFETKPYDRQWIYRAHTDGVIVDVIWAMANHRTQVDQLWMSGPQVEVRGRTVKVVPPEALLWDKLYIMQRERCDWPDIMNLVYFQGREMNWDEVLRRLGDDVPLLAGALSVFRWLSPAAAAQLPETLWERVNLPAPESRGGPAVDTRRASFLDTRPWYAQEPVLERSA